MNWKGFGASVRGPGHITTSMPNQDAGLYFNQLWGLGLVVSDGVGSKPFSNFGSQAVCRAVASAALASYRKQEINRDFLLEQIKVNWLSLLKPLNPRDCSATCLFALRLNDEMIHLGMLGDGLVAVLKTDGKILQIKENKEQGFSNTTQALSQNVAIKDWQYLSLPEAECNAILLCTDGVADDLVDGNGLDSTDGFVVELLEAYRPLAATTASRYARDMLNNWPTPKHSDDKTLACLYREEVIDG